MLKAAAERGWLNERDAALEALMCFRRAGADLILTYYSVQVRLVLGGCCVCCVCCACCACCACFVHVLCVQVCAVGCLLPYTKLSATNRLQATTNKSQAAKWLAGEK
jgi:hypothetical protein